MGGKGSGKRPRIDWSAVDWSRNNSEIARRHGVSHEAARRARLRYGAPPKTPAASARLRDYARRNKARLHGLRVPELLAAAGVSLTHGAAAAVLRAAGVRPAREPRAPVSRPSRLGRADWRLPDTDLSRIWNVATPSVLQYRRRWGHPAALWDLRDPATRGDPEYRRVLRAEERRARAAGGVEPRRRPR